MRSLENLVTVLPFVCYLVYESELLLLLLVAAAVLLVFFGGLGSMGKVISTPFGKTPFENIVGFKKSFLLMV